MADSRVVVIDLGSEVLKAGFSCDDGPKVVFPNIYGEPKDSNSLYLN